MRNTCNSVYCIVELIGFGLIRPEIKTDPTCTDLGRFWAQFRSRIGLEFGTEKFYRLGFGFNIVVTTGSGLSLDSGSIYYAGLQVGLGFGFVKPHCTALSTSYLFLLILIL